MSTLDEPALDLTGDRVGSWFPDPGDPSRPALDDPIALLERWLEVAATREVVGPTLLSLATADATGRPSNRVVRIETVGPEGLLFTTHVGSRKGRELAARPWAAGVLFWRETTQQVVLSGPVSLAAPDEADAIWAGRTDQARATTSVCAQSVPLTDPDDLAARARAALEAGATPRPAGFRAYRLRPVEVEFWQGSPDGLHRRLHYVEAAEGWRAGLLQP